MKPSFLVPVAAIAGAVACGLIWLGVLQQYRSEGTLLLESDLQEYKRFFEVIDNPSTLAEYQTLLPAALEVVKAIDASRGRRNFGKSIADAVYRVSKQDAKEIGETINFAGGGQPVIGIRLSVQARDAETARASAAWSGEFVRDAVLRDTLQSEIRKRTSDVRVLLPNLDSQLAKEQFEVESTKQRITALNDVRNRYKSFADNQTQQTLLNIERADSRRLERFLPVSAQLIAAESRVIESNQTIALLQRKRKQAEFELAFFESLEKNAAGAITGRALADAAQKAIDRLQSQYKGDSVLAETVAEIQRAVTDLNLRFTQKVRFVSSPSLPDRVSGPGLVSTILVGALLSALLALVVVNRQVLLRILLGSPSENADRPN